LRTCLSASVRRSNTVALVPNGPPSVRTWRSGVRPVSVNAKVQTTSGAVCVAPPAVRLCTVRTRPGACFEKSTSGEPTGTSTVSARAPEVVCAPSVRRASSASARAPSVDVEPVMWRFRG
jgi:hypothetical protein